MGNARILDPSEQRNRLGDGATIAVLVPALSDHRPQRAPTHD